MASKNVVEAVTARLAVHWNKCPVIGPNMQGEAPEDGSPFLVVHFPVSNENQISIGAPGNNVFRENGAFRIIINAKRGKGTDEPLAWADELRSLFRAKQFGGVNTWAPSPPTINDDNDDGNYFVLSFAVPYYADILA